MATEQQNNPVVYFDIEFAGEPAPTRTGANRIVLELYSDVVPITATNFLELCKGEKTSSDGVPLKFAGSGFHRVIPKFMIQGGDFTRGDGTGGLSIYGDKFADEKPGLGLKHDRPFLLSMANAGPDTNGSQFFITTVPTPHLDGKHVVFGQVLKGKAVVRRIENAETLPGDKPKHPITIKAAGQLDRAQDGPNNWGIQSDESGDAFEEFPEDQDDVDTLESDPTKALAAATTIKGFANTLFSKANYGEALTKYTKALRYCNLHPVLPDGTDASVVSEFSALKISIQLNAALCALKTSPAQPRVSVQMTDSAIATLSKGSWDSNDSPEAKKIQQDLAKAHFRRALAHIQLKNEDAALDDLNKAKHLAPSDPAIQSHIKAVHERKANRVKAQRAAYSKMFSS
ncbi:peptidyl-prolyl cis-trans isomerase D [Testicularia cyperi]|uniref:peptidylprolyl isomerase n=1 Tax=Testicularia cyperi TaxID=1882483 RepID=A0A317XVB3_9BASI|nr:peptidyl-prolyl cis-trans isomerase D [Testicularia cyperi]